MASLFSATACLLSMLTVCVASSSPLTVTQSQKPNLSNRKALLFSVSDAEETPILVPNRDLILEKQNQTKLIKSKKKIYSTTPTPTTNIPSSHTSKIKLHKTIAETKSIDHNSTNATKILLKKPKLKPKSKPIPSDEQDRDLVTEFRNLPGRLQKTLLPDLERISATSRAYLSAANAGVIQTVESFRDTKYAPQIAPLASSLLIILTLLLFTTVIRRLGSCLFLLHFIQAYLAIYFATLALAAVLAGQEPLRFFHVESPMTYTWAQLVQSLGYVAYLLLQLSDLAEVFASPANGEATRVLGLVQMAFGLGVGLHYYTVVFHRAVAGEAPLSTWQVHAAYAVSFAVICVCSRMDRRKKAYTGMEGEEDCKNS